MVRKSFLRYLPEQQVSNHTLRQVFGDRLHDPNLWHLNRQSVSGGIAIGLFCAYLPMPMEMVPAALGAIVFRANLPIAVSLVWISNPLTWVPLYGPAYILGAKLLGKTPALLDEMTVHWLVQHLASLWLGCLIIGTAVSVAAYLMIRTLWRIRVASLWHSRRSQTRTKLATKVPNDPA
ncbi:MAG: DUF2062 domain-containing protein [Gammaproteobacteria bacterium]|nr:DUF2062 domain-containing protein [Gammaproteobacteria bacterium]